MYFLSKLIIELIIYHLLFIMGIILSSKKASLLTSPWFFSWTMYVLKNSVRRGKRYIPDPKRSFESIFQNLQGRIASPSHIAFRIKQKIPDVTSYPKAAFESIKDKVSSVPETLSQIKRCLPDVTTYPKAAFENLKEKAESASEAAQRIKEAISEVPGYSMTKLENLKEKVDSVCHGFKDEILPGIASKARSKMNFFPLLPIHIPTRSGVIKTMKPYVWRIVFILIGLYLAKMIISYLLSRFEALVQWILKKSGEYLLIFLKKIWNIVLQGIKFIWNKIIHKWQSGQSRSDRQDTDFGAEENTSDHQNHNQASSEGQRVDASGRIDVIQVNNNAHFKETRTYGILQESGEKCSECQQQLKVTKVGNAPIQVCLNSQCAFYSPLE